MVIHSVVSSAQKKVGTKAETKVGSKWMDLDSAEQKVRMR
jgi:hypothetical protein